MKICNENLQAIKEQNKVVMPTITPKTAGIAHFGVGAFHRSHQALYTQLAMEGSGQTNWGIIGVGIMPFDIKMNKVLKQQDFLYTLVEKSPDKEPVYRIINSLIDHIYAPEELEHMVSKLAEEGIAIITLTITEGGYYLKKDTGEFDMLNQSIIHDQKNWQTATPRSIFGYLAKVMHRRMTTHGKGVTLLSCDNIQHNGKVAEKTFLSFLIKASPEMQLWVKENCSFPNSMVDRITPQISLSQIEEISARVGILDEWPVVSEDFIQWVIEDRFVGGRPAWEKGGAQFVEDVTPYEKMKLRVLNGSHQALCYPGSLSGLTYVHEAAQNETIRQFMKKYLKQEVRETLDPVPGIDIVDYENTVIHRFSNANVLDTLSRICEFTSDRIPLFNVPSMIAMREKKKQIPLSAMIIATWIVYAQGVNEKGNELPLVDNRKKEVQEAALKVKETSDISHFLGIKGLFGQLQSDQQFCKEVQISYDSIKSKGVMEAIRKLI